MTEPSAANGIGWRAMPRPSAQKMSHLLAAELRRTILNGELAADQQLPSEPELTAALRISRETLREALRILESQQLVEIKRGRGGGAVVRRPGLDGVGRYVALLLQLRRTTLAHLEEARTVIEPPAAEQVAMRAGYDDLDALVVLHDAERAAEGDPLSFVTAMTAFEQAVTDLSGNTTLAVFAGVFRDIYAGQVYSAIGTDTVSAERIARRVIVSHSAFLDAARRRDSSLAQKTWNDYLFTTSRLLVNRNASRQLIDMTPLWRAQAGRQPSEPAPRRAMIVATEIRSRIAEGKLREGDRLPPLAELADEFGISRPTLREALRILEMEFLLELRTGDRAGATIRTPSSRVAAQLAGIVLEARGATLSDFYRAMRLIEPPMMGLVAARVTPRQLRSLETVEADLADAVEDTPRFVTTLRDAEQLALSAVRNPALTVVSEILHWVRVGVEPAVTADAKAIPSVSRSNRNFAKLFSEFVAAAAAHDSARAETAWANALEPNAPWIEESELGQRLMLDLMG